MRSFIKSASATFLGRLLLLNLLVMMGSGAWLASLGEWGGIGNGILMAVVGVLVIFVISFFFGYFSAATIISSIAIIGSIAKFFLYIVFRIFGWRKAESMSNSLEAFCNWMIRKILLFAVKFGVISATIVFFSVWIWLVFQRFIEMSNSDNFIPYLVWAWSVVTTPGVYFYQHLFSGMKQTIKFFSSPVLFFQLACGSLVILVGFFDVPLEDAAWVYLGIMGVEFFNVFRYWRHS